MTPGSLGIVLGGSGNGEQMAANKVRGIRAALAYSAETGQLAREHNDAQVVSIGARMNTVEEAREIVDAFLATHFSGAEPARPPAGHGGALRAARRAAPDPCQRGLIALTRGLRERAGDGVGQESVKTASESRAHHYGSTVTTQVDVVARRRRAVQLTRAIRRGSLLGRIASSVTIAVTLCAVSVLLTLAMGRWPLVVSYAAFAPVVVVAGLFLPLRWFVGVLGVIAVLMTWAATEYAPGKPGLGGAVLILGIIAAMMLALCLSRSRLGVQGTLGESMLVDLRDRLRAHGVLPALPEPLARRDGAAVGVRRRVLR